MKRCLSASGGRRKARVSECLSHRAVRGGKEGRGRGKGEGGRGRGREGEGRGREGEGKRD